jgi:hypothetical protein
MNQAQFRMFSSSVFFVISIVGLAMVPLMVIQPNLDQFELEGQRTLIGVLFCAVCVSGVVAVFYPGKCSGVFQHTPKSPAKAGSFPNNLRIEGHHPNCLNFSKNRITVGGRVFCAACAGLLVGSMLSIIGAIVYFLVGLNLVWGGIWLVVLGEIGMALGLAQVRVTGFIKVTFNSVFVVGSFATLAAVDALGKSLFLDLYVLGLILFLLWFRISLSEWNNNRTCRKCQRCLQ